MSLDIQLSPFLVSQLFKTSLVDFKKPAPMLGNNEKNILIFVNESNVPFIEDENLTFLTNILSACGLTLNDAGLLNIADARVHPAHELTQKAPSVAIFFGTDLKIFNLAVEFPFFQVVDHNNCRYLNAPALTDLRNDTASKKLLWDSLRKVFSIK